MRIQKIGHSCFLIEDAGSRLLIDPGAYSFAPIAAGKPEDLGPVDGIVITHEHQDHFSIDAIKRILAVKSAQIVSHARIQELLAKEGITAEVMREREERTIGSFKIQAFAASHELLPRPAPPNLGFFINETLFHPGDSLTFVLPQAPTVFALPVAAPWLTAKWAVEIAIKRAPKIVIPIHDAAIKDFSLKTLYGMFSEAFAKHGIEFHPLAPGESLTI